MDNALAVEIDTKLAALYVAQADALRKLDSAVFSLAYAVGVKPVYVTKTRREVLTPVAELLEMAVARVAANEGTYIATETQRSIDKYEALKATLVQIAAERAPLEAIYNENRWSRFFLVTNANGHIHSSMNCSTCNTRTQFAWLPELSGLTEADAVAAHGPHLCSVCFPSAPVEWTLGEQKDTSDECPGSRTFEYTNRSRVSYTGTSRATCNHCHQNVGVTTSGKMRAHKKASA